MSNARIKGLKRSITRRSGWAKLWRGRYLCDPFGATEVQIVLNGRQLFTLMGRRLIRFGCGQQIDGEGGEPMLAFVVPAGDVFQRGLCVPVGRFGEEAPGPV